MKMKAICIRNEDGNSMNHWFNIGITISKKKKKK